MKIDPVKMQAHIDAKHTAAFYGKRYFYVTQQSGNQVVGILKALGDMYIAGYIRESGSRCALKAKTLWASRHPEDLQKRLDDWAKKRGLTEVPQ